MIQKWEYLTVYQDGTITEKWEGEKISLQDFLNNKGRDGWELVQGPTYGYSMCIFKRPLP